VLAFALHPLVDVFPPLFFSSFSLVCVCVECVRVYPEKSRGGSEERRRRHSNLSRKFSRRGSGATAALTLAHLVRAAAADNEGVDDDGSAGVLVFHQEEMADMSPMAHESNDLDNNNHNENHHSPTGSSGSCGSTSGTTVNSSDSVVVGVGGLPMLVVHKREMVRIVEEQHHVVHQHHQQQMDDQPMDEDDGGHQHHQQHEDDNTDGDALSPQKRPLNNNNNDVATVFLIDASDVEGGGDGHEDHDPVQHSDQVEVEEVMQLSLVIHRLSRSFSLSRCYRLRARPH